MDLVLSLPIQTQEDSKISSTSGEEDRISSLPDDVLCDILSLLPTKDAVGTSILSKRWTYIWTFVPNLDIDERLILDNYRPLEESTDETDSMHKLRCLMNFVDSVLFLHNSFCIRKFRLACYAPCTAPCFYAWIYAVATSKVQEIELRSIFNIYKDLPPILFTCRTLVVLKISGSFVLNLPRYICLPNLKALHLDSVFYADDASIQRFLSSCAALEDLVIRRITWDGTETLNISVPSLKRLTVYADITVTERNNRWVMIHAPNLEYLYLSDHFLENYSVNILPFIVEARLDGPIHYEILELISHVKHLFLSSKNQVFRMPRDLPKFHNLTHIELGLDIYAVWQYLPSLFESSRCLEALVLKLKGNFKDPSFTNDRSLLQNVAYCLVMHLKTIQIHRFKGKKIEVQLVKYFLTCAKVLEKMEISCFGFPPEFEKELALIKKELMEFPRSSSVCELIFTRRVLVKYEVQRGKLYAMTPDLL